MRGYASADRILAALLALPLLLGGCQPRSAGGRFEISALEAHWANGEVRIHCEQALRLSESARQALGHGVPLTFELELILRSATSRTRVAHETLKYEIRFLPMSEHYQVTRLADGGVRTYPRLRHALADLGRLDLDMETGALPADTYELLARTRLDHARMPPPMRLPILFESDWRHASRWTAWPLVVDPPA